MQMELLLEPEMVASPVVTDLPKVPAGLTHTLSVALIAMHSATTPDQHADAVDAALTAAMPTVQRIAKIFAVSWPAESVDAEDLAQEALLEVTASLAFAPRVHDQRLAAWLSTTVFEALHRLWAEARDAKTALIDDALGELSTHHLLVLALRGRGNSWRAIASLLGTSVRGARRRGAHAVAATRIATQRRGQTAVSAVVADSLDALNGSPTATSTRRSRRKSRRARSRAA